MSVSKVSTSVAVLFEFCFIRTSVSNNIPTTTTRKMSSASFLLTSNFLLLTVTFSSSFAVDLWQRRDLNNASFERIHFTDEEIHRFNEDNAKFHPADDDDRETSHDFGEFMAEFFHGSSSQLIVDLDLLRELWTELEKAREAAAAGDVDHIQV